MLESMTKPFTMKVVGRTGKADPIEDARILQRTGNRLLQNMIGPCGVFRFKTHKEADQWMTQQLINMYARRTLKIS